MNMRTLSLYLLTLALIPAKTSFAVGGQIELNKHRFNRHTKQQFERLVLEFKNHTGQGLPSIRIATDTAAGEVTIQSGEVLLKGVIPESEVNDRFVPKSKLLGPISVSSDNLQGGFTLRTFLKDPEARIDAFWLGNPVRLVVDAYSKGAPRTAALPKTNRSVASRKKTSSARTDRDVWCFPAAASIGMKVTFQGDKKADPIAVPVEAGAKTSGTDAESVVCYPKQAQLHAAIAFDPEKTVAVEEEAIHKIAITPIVEEKAETPAVKAVAKPQPLILAAPANSLLNKSPLAAEPPKPVAAAEPPAPPVAAKPVTPPVTGLTLPAFGSPTVTAPLRTVSGTSTKPMLNLPMSLPSIPLGLGTAQSSGKLALPPPPPSGQAPTLLPPLSTK